MYIDITKVGGSFQVRDKQKFKTTEYKRTFAFAILKLLVTYVTICSNS